jgi:hypothetical protein
MSTDDKRRKTGPARTWIRDPATPRQREVLQEAIGGGPVRADLSKGEAGVLIAQIRRGGPVPRDRITGAKPLTSHQRRLATQEPTSLDDWDAILDKMDDDYD